MSHKLLQRLGLSLVLVAALFSGVVLPVAAAAQPTVAVVDLVPGSLVRLEFANLPANTKFAVMMGAGGSGAVGAPTVAHVYSSDGSVVVAWFEILSDLSTAARIDVRVDDGAGLSATTSFDNTSSSLAVSANAPVAAVVPVTGAGGATTTTSTNSNAISIVHVEKGGIVVASLNNLPADTSFTVSLGTAGTQGVGGNVVGHLDTSDTNNSSAIGTFEIPVTLMNETSIDLRLESVEPGGTVYWVNFQNVDK